MHKAGDGSFHRLCMICSRCNQQADEGARFANELLVCKVCVDAQGESSAVSVRGRPDTLERASNANGVCCASAATEKQEREEREAREAAERAAAKAKAEKEAAEAAARALLQKKEREAAEAVARKKREQEEREERARAEKAAEARKAKEAKEAAEAAAAAATRSNRGVSHANLDQFDLGALDGQDRMSEFSDFGSDYSFMTNNDSMRLSEVLDLESIDAFNNGARSSRGFDRLSTLSDLSTSSDRVSDARADRRTQPSSLREDDSEYLSDEDGEQELCGGCNLVLEGEAVGALNRYFHYEVRGGLEWYRVGCCLRKGLISSLSCVYDGVCCEQCFKCSYCRKVIAEDDGYAEKDNKVRGALLG